MKKQPNIRNKRSPANKGRFKVRTLAGRDDLDESENLKFLDAVDALLDEGQRHELRNGNSDALVEILDDKEERFDLAEKYLQAETSLGEERNDALRIVELEKKLFEMDKQQEIQANRERLDALYRERSREQDDGLEL